MRLFPPEEYEKVGRLSKTALERMDLSGKIIIWIQERRGQAPATDAIRLSSSSDGGMIAYVTNMDSGKVDKFTIPPLSIISTTTDLEIHNEDDTRSITIAIDYDETQGAKVVKYQAHNASYPESLQVTLGEHDPERVFIIREAIRMLEPLEVIIPYQNLIAESLDLSKPRVQRDHLKLIGNVYTLAYLHQKQRDKLIIGDKEYIIANYQDLMNAIKYTFPFINDSYMGLDASTRKVYDIIKELSSKWTENSKGIHTNDIVKASNEKFGKGRKWADKRLEKLLNQSMITRDYLRNDVDIPGYYYNIIFNYRKSLIDVELTEESLKAETLKWEDDIKKRLPDSEIKKYFPSV